MLLAKKDEVKKATPVEGKGRVSDNTFHKTINCFNETYGLADLSGLGEDSTTVKNYDLNTFARIDT